MAGIKCEFIDFCDEVVWDLADFSFHIKEHRNSRSEGFVTEAGEMVYRVYEGWPTRDAAGPEEEC